MNMRCKCGQIVCMKHRYSDKHPCTFDFHNEESKKLEKKLVKVVAPKIAEIL